MQGIQKNPNSEPFKVEFKFDRTNATYKPEVFISRWRKSSRDQFCSVIPYSPLFHWISKASISTSGVGQQSKSDKVNHKLRSYPEESILSR